MLSQRMGLGIKPVISRNLTRTISKRFVSTVQTSHDYEQEILVAQRRNRPTSPHLTIYQPQLTWILSSFHRITGVYMAGGFYALTCGYVGASLLGYEPSTQAIVDLYATLPEAVKVLLKSAMLFPFFFHFGNGLRHLVWDTASQLTLKGVYRTGYAVLGFTAALGSLYAFFV